MTTGPPIEEPADLPPDGPDVDDGWRRVHPLTPLITSWQILVVALVFVGQDVGRNIFGGLEAGGMTPQGLGLLGWLIAVGIVTGLILIGVGLATLSWRMTRYRVTREVLEIKRGVLFRQHRLAQLDRIQAVDVVQPLLARVVGLSRLNVEVAGAGESNLQLSFLSDETARQMRNLLLAGAAGLAYDTEQAPRAPEHHRLEVPIGRLIGSILLSGGTAVVLIVGMVSLGAMAFAPVVGPAAFVPIVIGAVGASWGRLTRGFGFRVATSPDGLRLRHGLLEQRSQTVPPGRVQAVRVSQPLLWRPLGWWRVQVNVAGYGASGDDEGSSESTLLPVGPRDDAAAVLWYVFPDLGLAEGEDPGALLDAALTGSGGAGGFRTSPPSARWLDWFSWRRNGFRPTRTALLIREGVLVRSLVLVPHARTQSLGVSRGPLQRWLGLASFHLHSTPGPISPMVRHLAAPVAAHLLAEQAELARRARAAAPPERWMSQPDLPGPDVRADPAAE